MNLDSERSLIERNARLERWISQRTWGRVHNLQVEVVNDRVLIRGRTRSHYHRQLALAAAMEATNPERPDVRIEVDSGRP